MPETRPEGKNAPEGLNVNQAANGWLDQFTTPDNLILASRALRIGHVLNAALGGTAVVTGHPYLVPVFVGLSGILETAANKIDIKAEKKIGSDPNFGIDRIFGGYKRNKQK